MGNFFKQISLGVSLSLLLTCGGGGGGDSSSGEDTGGQHESGECDTYCGTEEANVSVNLQDAKALFTVSDTDGSSTSSLIDVDTSGKFLTTSTSSPLFAITDDGIDSNFAATDPRGDDAISTLPRLSFIALSPIGEVYLAFEHPWIFTSEADGIPIGDYLDPWAPSSPFTCQIFVVHELIGEVFSGSDMNLTCLHNGIEINTFDARYKAIQFDDAGNAYFAAHVPGNWKDLLWKYTTNKGSGSGSYVETIPSSQISEVINANICFQSFQVTAAGGVLYTGQTSTDSRCGGEQFFRFITPTGQLQQVTAGWYEYTFAPIEVKLVNGTVANNYYIGHTIFFGPDPTIASTPGWNDACLFRFDPAASGASRSTKIADCNIDVWQYINLDSSGNNNTETTQQTRCEEKKNMMGGGNQPDKILLANRDSNDDLNEIYIVGNVFEKAASKWKCDMCTNGTPASYCNVSGTLHFEHKTTDACAKGGGTWVNTQSCYNGQVDTKDTGNVCTDSSLPANWELNHEWCDFSGNDSRSNKPSLARVDEKYDGTNNRIVRLSGDNERVENGWVIGKRLAYLAYNATEGQYELREVGKTSALITGIEIYELMQDPRNSTLWFFNGLRFSDNQYVLGTFNPDASKPGDTLSVESGLTGQIDTLVIVE